MNLVTAYKEFNEKNIKSILDHISDKPIKNKDIVLRYMKNGEDNGVRCTCIYDYVKNEMTSETVLLFTDGEYYWNSQEIYHFEKYNLELNEDFIKKILK